MKVNDEFQELEQQIMESRWGVRGLDSAEKAQLCPAYPEPQFPWARLAGAVGICSILIIGILSFWVASTPSAPTLSGQSTQGAIASNNKITRAEAELIALTQATAGAPGIEQVSENPKVTISSLLTKAEAGAMLDVGLTAGSDYVWVVTVSGVWRGTRNVNDSDEIKDLIMQCMVAVDANTGKSPSMVCPYNAAHDTLISAEMAQSHAMQEATENQSNRLASSIPPTIVGSALLTNQHAWTIIGRDVEISAEFVWLITLQGAWLDNHALTSDNEPRRECAWFIDAGTGETLQVRCPQSAVIDVTLISEEQATATAITAAQNRNPLSPIAYSVSSARFMTIDDVVEDDLNKDKYPTDYFWYVELDGELLLDDVATAADVLRVAQNIESCAVMINAEANTVLSTYCFASVPTVENEDELVSAELITSTLIPRLNESVSQFTNRAEIVSTAINPGTRRGYSDVEVTIEFEYAGTENEIDGNLIVRWGYFLDETSYNMNDLIVPIVKGDGTATYRFQISNQFIEDGTLEKFAVNTSLRPRASQSINRATTVYLQPPNTEPALSMAAVEQHGVQLRLVQDPSLLPSIHANVPIKALLVHHAMLDQIDTEFISQLYDEGVLIVGIGAHYEHLLGEIENYDDDYATPFFYTMTYKEYVGDPNSVGGGTAENSLIFFDGWTEILNLIERVLEY